MRLIDADKLMESIRKALGIKSMTKSLLLPAERTIIDQIDSAPAVCETTRPVFNGRYWECEECGQQYKDILVVKEYKHCPGCGRKIERWY